MTTGDIHGPASNFGNHNSGVFANKVDIYGGVFTMENHMASL